METKKLYAKSDGEPLIDHLNKVENFSLAIYSNTFVNDEFEYEHLNAKKIISITSKLHDIGKATKGFQRFLTGRKKKTGFKFSHGEIAWSFLMKHLDFGLTFDEIEIISNNVYWHHGISHKLNSNKLFEIYSELSESDIERLKNVVKEILGHNSILNEPREGDIDQNKTPLYYDPEKPSLNTANIIIRSCVLSADRLVSEMGVNYDVNNTQKTIDNILNRKGSFYLKECPFNDPSRFNLQREIVLNSIGRTTIIHGPGGWGKTFFSLQWLSNEFSIRKGCYVLPTNTMSEQLYISVCNELKNSNNLSNVSVELFLTGEVQRSHNKTDDIPFSSDIIITNIDNFLSLSTKNEQSKYFFMLSGVDVIFDEFHEFVSDSALFSLFIEVMKIRHQYTDSRTLLLSATPMKLSYLWDTVIDKTVILPNEKEHYPAVHDKKYHITTKVCNDIEDIIPDNENQLIKFNAISNAQEYYKIIKEKYKPFVIHSKYEKSRVIEKIGDIFKLFGKNNNRNEKKPIVISTPILQTSLDLSFGGLIDCVFSFDRFLQAIARADRWGDYLKEIIEVQLVKLSNNRPEDTLIKSLYSIELSSLFYQTMQSLSGKKLTLNELYEIYNKFYIDNEKLLKKYINKKKNESLNNLGLVYPKKYIGEKDDNVIFAGGNKLRTTTNNEIWVIYEKTSGGYTEPFSVPIYTSHTIDFDEPPNIENLLFDTMDLIQKNGETRYDYKKILDKRKRSRRSLLDFIRNEARKSTSPYIVFNYIYDDELGLIKK